MDPSLYKAARWGGGDWRSLDESTRRDALLSLTPDKNTALHITAISGQTAFAEEILGACPNLLCKVNLNGDTALHLAARYGHRDLVCLLATSYLFSKHLVQSSMDVPDMEAQVPVESGSYREEGEAAPQSVEPAIGVPELEAQVCEEAPSNKDDETTHHSIVSTMSFRMKNVYGNTALHEALKNKREVVALHLLDLDPELARFVNKGGESPLYLAAQLDSDKVLKKILTATSSFSIQGPYCQTPLMAAVIAENYGSSTALIEWKDGELVKRVDSRGRTALHYAAQAGNFVIAFMLLREDHSVGYVRDKDGLSPLLVAVTTERPYGLWTAINILYHCPDSVEVVDKSGHNALHIALLNNNTTMLKNLLISSRSRSFFVGVINQGNKDGNTPLHLAVIKHSYDNVKILTEKYKGVVDLNAKNKKGETALDICEKNLGVSYEQVSIRRYLLKNGTPQSQTRHSSLQLCRRHNTLFNRVVSWLMSLLHRILYLLLIQAWSACKWILQPEPNQLTPSPLNNPTEDLKPMANTLSLVATLLATITFAAAFTMPGGYKSDGPNQGTAVLIKKAALKVFLLSDTISMCCSIMSVFIIMKALVADPSFLAKSIGWSLIMINLALVGTMIAFATGAFVVISDECLWLAIVVCLMGCSVPILIARIYGATLYRSAYSIISRSLNPTERSVYDRIRKKSLTEKRQGNLKAMEEP